MIADIGTPFLHHHCAFVCPCGIIVGECLCDPGNKEIITFDECWHKKQKKRKKHQRRDAIPAHQIKRVKRVVSK